MKRKFLFAPAALTLAVGVFANSMAQAAEAPQYEIEDVTSLCPQTLDDATYTGDMGEFTKLVQGQDEWLFRTRTDLMTQMGTTPEGYAHLQQLRDALKARGTELMIVYIPTRGMTNADMLSPEVRKTYDLELAKSNYLTVVQTMRGLGIRVADLTPLLDHHGEPGKPFFYKRDHHWTPYGAEYASRIVAEELKKSDAYKQVPHKEFVSRAEGLGNKVGSLNQALNKLCGNSYASQYLSRFVTEPKDESGDLFGDEENAQIVLAGTSFSTPLYNFAGFLKENAQVDIDNRSVSGGGFHSSMLQYLGSQEFQERPPKVLIWEITSYYDISMPVFYRQIMPMLANGCKATPSAISKKVALRPGTNEILVNTGLLPITSESYVADIQFSQPGIKELQSAFWYLSGSKDKLRIERTREVEGDGRFVFRLRDDGEWAGQTLLSMEIEMPPDMPQGLEVEANICPRKPGVMQASANR